MLDEPLFALPRDRTPREPREADEWDNWPWGGVTCDSCALQIGTQTATHPPQHAQRRLTRVDGSIGAYCRPHAESLGDQP